MFAVLFSLSCQYINALRLIPENIYYNPKIDAEHAIYERNSSYMKTMLYLTLNRKVAQEDTQSYKSNIEMIEKIVDLFHSMVMNLPSSDKFCYLRATNYEVVKQYYYKGVLKHNNLIIDFTMGNLRLLRGVGKTKEQISDALACYSPAIEKELEKRPDITSQYRFRFEIEMFKIFFEHLKKEFSRHEQDYRNKVSQATQTQLVEIQQSICDNCLDTTHEYNIYSLCP